MKTSHAWRLAALAVVAIGCNKSDTTTSTGGVSGAAAKAPTPDAEVQAMFNSMAAGDAGGLWNYLPPKYQTDVKDVKNVYASKMDADVWNKSFVILGKVGTLLKDKKEFILKTPALAANVPPPVREGVEKHWDAISGAVNTLASSEIKTIDGLKAADPGKFLGTTGNALLAAGVKAADTVDPASKDFMNKIRKAKVTLVKQDGDTATLKLETEGEEPEEKEFKKVEGKWLPADVVDSWDANLADMKRQAASFVLPPQQKTQFTMMAAMVESTVDSLLAAKDQSSFDASLTGIMALMGVSGGGPAMMGGPPPGMLGPPPGMKGPSLGGPGGLPVPEGLPALNPPAGAPPAAPK